MEMHENNMPGVQFRDNLFKIFMEINNENDSLLDYYLEDHRYRRTKRTNLFLGVRGRSRAWETGERKFTRFKEDDKKECLLKQLHSKLYHTIEKNPPEGFFFLSEDEDENKKDLVMFEYMSYDCAYFPCYRLKRQNKKFPIAWSYDWIIEVENEFDEFAFTLRGLLDINCNNRMGIFFCDNIDLNEIKDEFKIVWNIYKNDHRYRNAIVDTNLSLHALIFPDTFRNIDDYLKDVKLIKWDKNNSDFISL